MFNNLTDDEIIERLEALGCTTWDAADYLNNEATIEAYLNEARESCLETEMQPFVESHIVNAIETVNRARVRNFQSKK